MRKAIIFMAVAFLLVFCAVPVYADDILPLPHAFCGTVDIDGSPAPENTTVEARGKGVITGGEGNPITVTEEGKFGSPEPLGQKLIVKGDIANGTDISFLVNGTYTGTTFGFKEGETTVLELNLVITATSITGEVEEIIPSNQTDYEVDASDIADTTITVDTIGVVTITVEKYASDPHPGATPPADTDMLPRYIDIDVDNADAIDWPMYVEQTYTDEEIAGLDESSLGMCYFTVDPLPDGAWHRCSETDVYEDKNIVWANIYEKELPGCPIAIGGTAAPEPEPEPEPTPTARGEGEGYEPPAPPPGTTDVRGKVTTAGRFTRSVTAASEDELCTLTIPTGTIGLTEELERLTEITILEMDDPPPPPEHAHIIGLSYDFGPGGATFDPAITLTWSYDPADIPEGVAEEDLVIAYYDEEAGEWVELEGCVVDAESKTITAPVSHFTTFAILVSIPPPAPAAFSVTNLLVIKSLEIQPMEAVIITVSVANTGGTEGRYTVVLKINGVKEAAKRVTVAAGRSQSVSFSVSKEDAGNYNIAVDGLSESFTVVAPAPVVAPVPPPAAPPAPAPAPAPAPPAPAPPEVIPPTAPNWPVIGGIIAATVILALLIFFLIRRRAY